MLPRRSWPITRYPFGLPGRTYGLPRASAARGRPLSWILVPSLVVIVPIICPLRGFEGDVRPARAPRAADKVGRPKIERHYELGPRMAAAGVILVAHDVEQAAVRVRTADIALVTIHDCYADPATDCSEMV